MYEKIAWETFLKTGNIDSYLEYKSFMSLDGNIDIQESEGDFLNGINKNQRNSYKRNSL